MRRTASEVLRDLEIRVAHLEKQSYDDDYIVRELELFIVNESDLYRMAQAIVKNQAKHFLKGRWNEAGAIKGFVNLVEAGIKAYRRQGLDLPSRISRKIKEEVAKNLLEYYEDEIEEAVGTPIRSASVKSAGRRYDDDEWVFFIHEESGLEDDRKGHRAAETLRERFEECVERICDDNGLSICEDDGVSRVAFKAFASLIGHGTGLWDHDHPEADTLEKLVDRDRKCGDLATKIDRLPYELGLA
tara:strand:- start:2579 stop:3310 length:732 start_codon:yes stop_codon:yes gene_type:complete